MAVAIVSPDGELVFFERIDNTQAGSIKVSQEKARTAAPTRSARPPHKPPDAAAPVSADAERAGGFSSNR